MARFTAVLTGWLRDDMLGPAPCPAAALVRLRAVQAALFTRGVLLRWDAAALGPGPAGRLNGDLTPGRAAMLAGIGVRPDRHRSRGRAVPSPQPPRHPLRAADPHRRRAGRLSAAAGPSPPARYRGTGRRSRDGTALAELACGDLVRVPACARPILAAHLAYRRGQGAADGDPYFISPRGPGGGSPERMLNNAVTRTCRAIGYDPPWLHGNDCRYGADIGLTAREPGWLAGRGLSPHRIDPAISDRVPPHGSPRQYRPASLDRPAATTPAPQPPRALYQQRIAAMGLSPWELGNLLGIHPHLLAGPALADQPARLLLELARALQMHPADLYPDLDTILGYRRAEPGPGVRSADSSPAGDRGGDAVTLLTALACARTPLGPADLSRALGWPLQRVTAALQHAGENPGTGGALTLRRVPPETYTAVPRPDILTSGQRHALTSIAPRPRHAHRRGSRSPAGSPRVRRGQGLRQVPGRPPARRARPEADRPGAQRPRPAPRQSQQRRDVQPPLLRRRAHRRRRHRARVTITPPGNHDRLPPWSPASAGDIIPALNRNVRWHGTAATDIYLTSPLTNT